MLQLSERLTVERSASDRASPRSQSQLYQGDSRVSGGFCTPHTQSCGSPCCSLRTHTEDGSSLRSSFLSVLHSESLCISRVKLPINVILKQQNQPRLQVFCLVTSKVKQDISQHTTALKDLFLPNRTPPLLPLSLTHAHTYSLCLSSCTVPSCHLESPLTPNPDASRLDSRWHSL